MTRFRLVFFLILATMANSIAQSSSITSTPSSSQDVVPNGFSNDDQIRRCGDELLNMTRTILDLLQKQNPGPTCMPVLVGRPRDCAEILAGGVITSGVYPVYPDGAGDPFFVYCDMETDGGGWTVFQRREDGSVDFYLYWLDYKYGFGSVAAEHWLGNDNIHRISIQKTYELRVDLEDFDGNTRYASYATFTLANEANKYKLIVGSFSGDAGDSLTAHSGSHFSTRDRDNDARTSSCAVSYHGAWWYKSCHSSNLNGQYLGGTTTHYAKGVVWNHWLGYYYSLKKSEMKIRPV